jgi:hypothetical protein
VAVRASLSVRGLKDAEGRYIRLSDAVIDMRPAWDRAEFYMEGQERLLFSRPSARTRWAPLKKSSIRRNGPHKLMHFTGDLERSLTSPYAPYAIRKKEPRLFVFGTTDPVANLHQTNRPVLDIKPKDAKFFRGLVREHLLEVT